MEFNDKQMKAMEIYLKSKDKKNKRKNILSRIMITLTQLASLLLILAQIYDLIE